MPARQDAAKLLVMAETFSEMRKVGSRKLSKLDLCRRFEGRAGRSSRFRWINEAIEAGLDSALEARVMAASAPRALAGEQQPDAQAEPRSSKALTASIAQLSDDENKRLVRVTVLFTPEEADKIDTWRFANRRPTRSDAIRSMIRHVVDSDLSLRHVPKPQRKP